MSMIAVNDLKALCTQALAKTGLPPRDVEICTDHLVENDICGKASHGVIRVSWIVNALKKEGLPRDEPAIETDTGSMIVMDARRNIGLVACRALMETAIGRAKTHGLALAGVHNFIATSGTMAYYLRRIADKGLACIMGCNSVALVAAPTGRERLIGTNPIGICVPGENGDHFIADLATSAIAYGTIMVMKDKGEPVPPGLLLDAEGTPSTDPADAMEGAIEPLADYKGFALGLMIELLSGPLIGGQAIKDGLYQGDGLFMILIDPSKLGNSLFYKQISEALMTVRGSKTRPGCTDVSVPGDRSAQILRESQKTGMIEIADKTLETLKSLAEGA